MYNTPVETRYPRLTTGELKVLTIYSLNELKEKALNYLASDSALLSVVYYVEFGTGGERMYLEVFRDGDIRIPGTRNGSK